MVTAYKYLKMNGGLLAVFEKGISFSQGLPLNIIMIENDPYLKIGQDHYIRLDKETIECLESCNRIHIAVSDLFESRITLQGTIEIDDVAKGKLLAYVEMNR